MFIKKNTNSLHKMQMQSLGRFNMHVVADIDKKKVRNVVRKTCTERRMICLLKHVKIWK